MKNIFLIIFLTGCVAHKKSTVKQETIKGSLFIQASGKDSVILDLH